MDFEKENLEKADYVKAEIEAVLAREPVDNADLLEVFPAYRRRGLAAALVQGMMRRRLAEGAIPFGHIVEGNEPSLRLQKKLGFSFSKEFVYWMD